MNLLYIDVETTGLDPEKCSIFQLSGIFKNTTTHTSNTFDYYVRPYRGERMDLESKEKTGKTDEELATYPDQKSAFDAFVQLVNAYSNNGSFKDKIYVVGYNATYFDMAFLRKWFEFNNYTSFGNYFWSPSIDVYHIAMLHCAGRRHLLKNFRLTTVYKAFTGKDLDNAHNSWADIQATAELLDIFMQDFKAAPLALA